MKTLIHFTADWCQPCKKMQPVIDELVNENVDLNYIKINIEKDTELFDYYIKLKPVMSVPTFWAVEGDEIFKSHIGVASKETLLSLVD